MAHGTQREPVDECASCGMALLGSVLEGRASIQWATDEPLRTGDFTWVTAALFPLVRRPLAEELRDRFGGVELGPVEIAERRLRVSDFKEGAPLSARFRAELEGLAELRVTTEVPLDQERSTLEVVRPPCAACGYENLMWGAHVPVRPQEGGLALVTGVEQWESVQWSVAERRMVQYHHEREPGHGIVVDADMLAGAGVFRLRGDRKWLLCTDPVRAFLVEREATNVAFLAAGELG